LSWRERVLLLNCKTFVPDPPLPARLFLNAIAFSPLVMPIAREIETMRLTTIRVFWQVWRQHAADVLPSALARPGSV
jgi:hypothetical protein